VSQPIIVCGHSLEVNVSSDLDLFLTPSLIALVSLVFNTNLLLLATASSHDNQSHADDEITANENANLNDGATRLDQRLASTLTAMKEDSSSPNQISSAVSVMPCEILITAGRISIALCTDGKINVNSDSTTTNATSEDNCETTENIAVEALQPHIYVSVSQPHAVLYCKHPIERLELACFDFNVRGCSSEGPLPAEGAERSISWIPHVPWFETKPGQPRAKSGILPSLCTVNLTDFITGRGSVSVLVDRPVKVTLSHNAITTFSQYAACLSVCLAETQNISLISSTAHKVAAPLHKNQPAASKQSTMFHVFHVARGSLSTCQIVLAYDLRDLGMESKSSAATVHLSVGGLAATVQAQIASGMFIKMVLCSSNTFIIIKSLCLVSIY
jgi:hypothetical protein